MSTVSLWVIAVCAWVTMRGVISFGKSIGFDKNVMFLMTRTMLANQDGKIGNAIAVPFVGLCEAILLPVQLTSATIRGTMNKRADKKNEVKTVEELFEIIIDLEERHSQAIDDQKFQINVLSRYTKELEDIVFRN